MGSNLFKAGGAYTVATFVLKGVNFFTIPIFTHLLTVSQYGVVNNFTAWVSIFSIFVGFNLNASINTAYHEYREDFAKFLSSILWLSFFIFVSATLIGIITIYFAINSYNIYFVLFVLIQSFVSFIISFQSTYYMIRNKYISNIIVSFISTLLNVSLSLVLMNSIFSSQPDMGRIIGSTLGLSLLAVPLFIMISIRGKFYIFDKTYWLYALKISLPLIPHAIGNFVISQFDRIMIQEINGNQSVGLYSFTYNIATIISVLWSASNNAWVPWFFKNFHNKAWISIRKSANLFTSAFMILTVVLMPVSVELSGILGSSNYSKGIVLIMPVTLGYFFQFLYGFPVNTEFVLKKTNFIGIGTGVAAVLNVVLNLLFLPRFGYMAAGYTTLITYIALFIAHYFIAKKVSSQSVFDGYWLFYASCIMVIYMFLQILSVDTFWLRYLIMILFIVIIVLITKKKLIGK